MSEQILIQNPFIATFSTQADPWKLSFNAAFYPGDQELAGVSFPFEIAFNDVYLNNNLFFYEVQFSQAYPPSGVQINLNPSVFCTSSGETGVFVKPPTSYPEISKSSEVNAVEKGSVMTSNSISSSFFDKLFRQIKLAVGASVVILSGITTHSIPGVINRPCYPSIASARYFSITDNNAIEAEDVFTKQLIASLRNEPLEDGMFHPGEEIIQSSFDRYPQFSNQWIQKIFRENYEKRPTITSGILRLLGRLPRTQIDPIGTLLVIGGLKHPEIEVRDSAVRTLESWGDIQSRSMLEHHLKDEPSQRLARYIQQVINDLAS